MCSRYAVAGSPHELAERFRLRTIPDWFTPTFLASGGKQRLPVVIEQADGSRELRLPRWGLIPRWRRYYDPFWTRVSPLESIFEQRITRPLLADRRCLVPASGYYAWQRRGRHNQPFFVSIRDEPLIAFAGLYQDPGSRIIQARSPSSRPSRTVSSAG